MVRYCAVCCYLKLLPNESASRAIGAVAVTVPTCWYLLQHAPDNSHGHEDHADSHAKSHHDEEGDEESKNEPEETSEGEDKDSEKTEASDSDDESQEGDTPETSDDESKDGENEGGKKGETTESGVKDEPNDKVCEHDHSLARSMLI